MSNDTSTRVDGKLQLGNLDITIDEKTLEGRWETDHWALEIKSNGIRLHSIPFHSAFYLTDLCIDILHELNDEVNQLSLLHVLDVKVGDQKGEWIAWSWSSSQDDEILSTLAQETRKTGNTRNTKRKERSNQSVNQSMNQSRESREAPCRSVMRGIRSAMSACCSDRSTSTFSSSSDCLMRIEIRTELTEPSIRHFSCSLRAMTTGARRSSFERLKDVTKSTNEEMDRSKMSQSLSQISNYRNPEYILMLIVVVSSHFGWCDSLCSPAGVI